MELMQASHQWATRPQDERFVSMDDLCEHQNYIRSRSRRANYANRDLEVVPVEGTVGTMDVKGKTIDIPYTFDLGVVGPSGVVARPTHWGFNMLCQRAGVPTSLIRNTPHYPAEMACGVLNWGLKQRRNVEDVSMLARHYPDDAYGKQPGFWLASLNGPDYGVVWNADVCNAVRDRFGNGLDGRFRIPGEFGKQVEITKENTTLYGSDRDCWMFLADEENRVEVSNRRNGEPGSFARGFFIGNSEVGSGTLNFGVFLFDYACCNRIIWGASQFNEIKIRHTKGAPHRFIEEVAPVLDVFMERNAFDIETTLTRAKNKKLEVDAAEFVTKYFAKDFGKDAAAKIKLAFEADEGAIPMETIFDVVTGATAWARGFRNQDERILVEKQAGKVLALAA